MLTFIQVIDKSFGFDSAVEEAQRAINAAHVEAESVENGIGVVKLMGRYSGKVSILYIILSYLVLEHVAEDNLKIGSQCGVMPPDVILFIHFTCNGCTLCISTRYEYHTI